MRQVLWLRSGDVQPLERWGVGPRRCSQVAAFPGALPSSLPSLRISVKVAEEEEIGSEVGAVEAGWGERRGSGGGRELELSAFGS